MKLQRKEINELILRMGMGWGCCSVGRELSQTHEAFGSIPSTTLNLVWWHTFLFLGNRDICSSLNKKYTQRLMCLYTCFQPATLSGKAMDSLQIELDQKKSLGVGLKYFMGLFWVYFLFIWVFPISFLNFMHVFCSITLFLFALVSWLTRQPPTSAVMTY